MDIDLSLLPLLEPLPNSSLEEIMLGAEPESVRITAAWILANRQERNHLLTVL